MKNSFFLRRLIRYKKFLLLGFIGVLVITTTVVVGASIAIASLGSWAAGEIKHKWDSQNVTDFASDTVSLSPFKERVVAVGRVGVDRWLSSHLVSQNFLAVSSGLKCVEYLGGPSQQKLAERIGVYLDGKPISQTFANYLNSDLYRESAAKSPAPHDCVNAVMNGV